MVEQLKILKNIYCKASPMIVPHFVILHCVLKAIFRVSFTLGTPTMPELLSFSDVKLNIAVLVGAKYTKFGTFLLEDKTGAVVEALEL